MVTSTKPLLSLTASDLMTQALVVIPRDMSLQGAARRLREANIHGAPVVDENGHCIGVISTMDFLACVEKKAVAAEPCKEAFFAPWQLEPGDLPVEPVSKYMRADPVLVPPAMPISELARNMLEAHLHRLIVVEHKARPVGIVSCSDILAAVAYAE